jgi:hypothetical protein
VLRRSSAAKPSPRNTADRPDEPMYDAIEDPCCYPETTVLKNRAGHRTQRALTQFETAMSAQRADEALPTGRLTVHHYQAIHRHLLESIRKATREAGILSFFLGCIRSFAADCFRGRLGCCDGFYRAHGSGQALRISTHKRFRFVLVSILYCSPQRCP